MAITQIEILSTEKSSRFRVRGLAEQTKVALRLVPDLNIENSRAVSSRAFVGFLIGVFTAGLLLLLSINTALTSGAFTLENMKLQLAAANDQRDALLNQVGAYSSPNNLALAATKLGMLPQASIHFLDVNGGSFK